jgi:hypothetical protein
LLNHTATSERASATAADHGGGTGTGLTMHASAWSAAGTMWSTHIHRPRFEVGCGWEGLAARLKTHTHNTSLPNSMATMKGGKPIQCAALG